MQIWECRIERIARVSDEARWEMGDAEMPVAAGWEAIERAITALGAEGWELIQVVVLATGRNGLALGLQAWFKRPAPA